MSKASQAPLSDAHVDNNKRGILEKVFVYGRKKLHYISSMIYVSFELKGSEGYHHTPVQN